jgi:predicted nucleic acid-binding protein
MAYLADTNILLRLLQRSDPDHTLVRSALRGLRKAREQVFYASQKRKS